MNFWDELNLKYEERLQDIKNSLAYGNVSSYDEYRQAVGTVEGLEWSRECLKEIINNRFKLEED